MEYLPDEETLFEGVRKLPAGHWLRWRNGRAERGRWFVPRFAPDAGRSLEESAEAIEAALRESVAAHAIARRGCGLLPLGRGGFQPRRPGGRTHHGGARVHHRLG